MMLSPCNKTISNQYEICRRGMNSTVFALTFVLAGLSSGAAAAHQTTLDNRDTVLQFYHWKYTDIADECDGWLAERRFAAIQVSPFIDPPKVPEVPWWKRYEPMTKVLDTRSGNSTQFIDMLRSCNAQGVKVLVDVSFNLQADPVLALGLADLPNATEEEQSLENTNVYHYLNYLLGLGVAGFYVKCNEPIDGENWERIFRTVYTLTTDERFARSERPIVLLETISEGVKSAVDYEDTVFTVISEKTYSKLISKAFRGKHTLKSLKNLPQIWDSVISNHSLINVEMSATSTKAFKIATAFALAHPYGIAKITTSYDRERFPDGPPLDADGVPLAPRFDTPESCDNGYMCEHRWWSVANMVDFRYIVGYEPLRNWWDNKNDQVAFSRGHKGFVVLNKEGIDLEETLQTGLPEGTYCDIITGGLVNGKCKGLKVQVDENGKALIFLPATSPDGVLAIHIESVLENV